MIISCFSTIGYSIENETLDNIENTTVITNIEDNQSLNVNYVEYDDEVIPDNNFEDGYENSEIIELNDSTGEEDSLEELVEMDDEIIWEIPRENAGMNAVGDKNAIVSNASLGMSVKVVLTRTGTGVYSASFSGSDNYDVYYTLNGMNPTVGSTLYNGAFVYESSKTLKYFVEDSLNLLIGDILTLV